MRPTASAFGEDSCGTLAERAGALLESLVIGHAFVDGNKRVAFAAMDVFVRLNGVVFVPDEDEAYNLVIDIASGRERGGVAEVARRLRQLFSPHLDDR